MSTDLRARADERFQAALAQTGARDPRDFLRNWMRDLKARDAEAYRRALAYFTDTLIPTVADEESDPLGEWLEYARVLAELSTRGRAVQIDATGRSRPYARPVPMDQLVLHLPEQPGAAALVLGIPPKMTPHQRAAYDLLVRQSLG